MHKRLLRILASVDADGCARVALDHLTSEESTQSYVAKDTHKTFPVDALENFTTTTGGAGAIFMDYALAEEIPNLCVLAKTFNCELIKVPPTCLDLNPAEGFWALLADQVPKTELKSRE